MVSEEQRKETQKLANTGQAKAQNRFSRKNIAMFM